jgi:septin family protein
LVLAHFLSSFLFLSYSAIEAYAKDQIKEYMELSRQIERPAQIVDKRIDLALFFVNGLTSRQYRLFMFNFN